jgi:integrase
LYIKHIELYKEYSTIQSYKYAASKFSDIADLKVKDIKKAHIQKNIDDLVREGLMFKTVYGHMSKIKLILQYYRENFNSAYIVFDNIKIPKDKKENSKKALTKKELDTLLKKLEKNKYYLVVLIAATCGLRCGEILGLTWNDVDLKKNCLRLNKQWKVNKKTKRSDFGNLKGSNSYREVPIPPSTVKILKKYKHKNPVIDFNNRIAPFSNSAIKLYLNPLLKELNGITLHELRHTYATMLVSNEIDFKTAAKFLGHDVKQTMQTYSHVTDEMIKKATNKISDIF